MTSSGDPALRTARIESRVKDYLKASQLRADKDQTNEARRLATVAHLVSRAAMIDAEGVESSASDVGGGVVIRTSGIDTTASPQADTRTENEPAAAWNESRSKPVQSAESDQSK